MSSAKAFCSLLHCLAGFFNTSCAEICLRVFLLPCSLAFASQLLAHARLDKEARANPHMQVIDAVDAKENQPPNNLSHTSLPSSANFRRADLCFERGLWLRKTTDLWLKLCVRLSRHAYSCPCMCAVDYVRLEGCTII